MSNFKTKVGALLITASLAGAGAGIGMPAYAQTTTAAPSGAEATPTAVTNPAAVDDSKPVKLSIEKFKGDPVEGDDTSSLEGLDGVQFEIKRIDADLTTNAGWQKVSDISANIAGVQDSDLDSDFGTKTLTTANRGKAEISTQSDSDFKVGAYIVTEKKFGNYSVAAPFIVTLPYNTDGGWVYERTVKPKNQEIKPDKQVDDSKAGIDQNLTYTINAPVPAGDLSVLDIKDNLVEQLELQADSIVVTTNGENLTLVKDTHYTVTPSGNSFTVSFNDEGRAELQKARVNNADLTVSVKFDAKITKLPETGDSITNTATVDYPNNPGVKTDVDPTDNPDDPSGPTKTTFANLELTKTGSEAGNLAGAEFDVFQCFQEDSKWKASGDAVNFVAADNSTTNKIVTTDDNAEDTSSNVYTAKGLIRSSFSGGNTAVQTNNYCVLETKAPAGFIANPEIVPATWVEKADDKPGHFTVSVENKKDTWSNRLPATGAMGIVLIFLVGLALLARGLYTSYRDRGATA